jgi:hypothetical protein
MIIYDKYEMSHMKKSFSDWIFPFFFKIKDSFSFYLFQRLRHVMASVVIHRDVAPSGVEGKKEKKIKKYDIISSSLYIGEAVNRTLLRIHKYK